MSKNTKQLVPKLRFPEFRDAVEWKKISLGSIGKVSMCKRILKEETRPSGDVPFYKIGTFGKLPDAYITREVFERYKKNYSYPKKGDILISASGTIGRLVVFDGIDAYFQDSNIVWIDNDESLVTNNFLFHCYNGIKWATDNNTIARLYNDNLSGMKIFSTSSAEQQKIADCLSSIDDLITAQSQKVEALKTHKKGLMQQLFPREGETVPRLRFPEFRGSGKWEVKPLKQVFSIFQGFAFSSNDSVPQGVRWLKIADVSIQQMNHGAQSYLPIEYQDKYEKFSVKEGDYVLALTRPILSGELKMARVDDVFHGALLNQRVGKLLTDQNYSFVYYLLQTSKLINDIDKSISGSEPPNLSAQQIEDLKTCIPKATEQQKIANCLSSISALISVHSQKLETLITYKKGLMQSLFPAADDNNAEEVV